RFEKGRSLLDVTRSRIDSSPFAIASSLLCSPSSLFHSFRFLFLGSGATREIEDAESVSSRPPSAFPSERRINSLVNSSRGSIRLHGTDCPEIGTRSSATHSRGRVSRVRKGGRGREHASHRTP